MRVLKARAWLWLIWCLLAFGAMNVYGPNLETFRKPEDTKRITRNDLVGRVQGVGAILMRLRDDDDVQRYYSYAQAILGRPYLSYFIRLTDCTSDLDQSCAPRVVSPSQPLRRWRAFIVD